MMIFLGRIYGEIASQEEILYSNHLSNKQYL